MKDRQREVPTDDLVEHTCDDCVCGPAQIPVVTRAGEVSTITVHHRLDGSDRNLGGRTFRKG